MNLPLPVMPCLAESNPPAWWADHGNDVFFMLLGGVISFYATIVYERYKQFGEILREIAAARIHAENYPVSPSDLKRAHDHSLELWRLLENRQWALDAQGQHNAAAQIGRLAGFVYRATACMERMLADQKQGRAVDIYFTAFQSEFARIKEAEFLRFENQIRPEIGALLRPYPRQPAPEQRKSILVDYFNDLL